MPPLADLFLAHRDPGRRAADIRSSASVAVTVLQAALVVCAVLGALWIVYALGTVILLLVLSVLFAYLVGPVVAFLQHRLAFGKRRQLPRGLAIGIAYLVFFAAVALLVTWVAPYVADAVKEVPKRMQAANGQPFTIADGWLRRVGVSASIIERGSATATGAVEAGAKRVAGAFVHVAAFLPWLVLIPILSFFLLNDAQTITKAGIRQLPERWRPHAPALLARMDAALAGYVRAQLVACFIVGGIVGVGFALLRVPFAAVLGIAAGIAEFVPLVGPLVIAVTSAIIAGFRDPMAAVWVLVFLGVLRVIEDYAIYPRLIGSSVHLHPLAVILAVLAGGELGGIVGVLLSVPALAIGSEVYRYFSESRADDAGSSDETLERADPHRLAKSGEAGVKKSASKRNER
jgi:predicted PurR-regulated permease PerM